MKKRIGLVSALVFVMVFSQAQQKVNLRGNTSFGLRGGINFQNINGKDENGDKLENDMLTGFNIGINAEIPVGVDFYFQPGLLYTVKGAKSEEVILGQTIEGKIKISYVELPLNFLYKPMLGTGHLLLGFGPYVALGVSGKATYEGTGSSLNSDVKFKNKVMTSDPDDVVYIRPLDAGANILAGYEFGNRVSFQLNTQLGLTKINPEYEGVPDDKTSAKNTGFGFSLGFRF
ncbi:MAG TPA: porin family protein [Chitinophagaceae bacterium]|nr:porin family protein [Chitinophagaceae bacterium]